MQKSTDFEKIECNSVFYGVSSSEQISSPIYKNINVHRTTQSNVLFGNLIKSTNYPPFALLCQLRLETIRSNT